MKLVEIKQSALAAIALPILDTTRVIASLLDKIIAATTNERDPIMDFTYIKVKNPTYNIVIFQDKFGNEISFRPKRFGSKWKCLNETELPQAFSKEIFEASYPEDKRQKLANKIVSLRAFW